MILRVVSGLATRQGSILMGKRKPDALRGGLWETPGGKVEPGESAVDALKREWREEVGIHVSVGPLIAVAVFDLEMQFAVELYHVTAPIAVLEMAKALDHEAITWVKPDYAAKHFPCSPAFYTHYPQIRRYFHEGGTL